MITADTILNTNENTDTINDINLGSNSNNDNDSDTNSDNDNIDEEYQEMKFKMEELYKEDKVTTLFKFIEDNNTIKNSSQSNDEDIGDDNDNDILLKNVYYDINTSLITDTTISKYINAFQHESGIINICAYHINTQGKYPFIQYILQKNNDLHETKPNMFTFPSFNFGLNTNNIMSQCDCILKIMFAAYCKNINELGQPSYTYKGFTQQDNNFYLFFDCTHFQIVSHKLSVINDLWLVLIDEIINHKSVCNFKIDEIITQFFLTNKEFLYLTDIDNNYIECPIVAYTGCHDRLVNFKLVFGQSPDTDGIIGPYYYFTDYNYALELATWSKNKKIEIVHGKQLTDENGQYNRGGIIRFALFTENTVLHSNMQIDTESTNNSTNSSTNSSTNEWLDTVNCVYINHKISTSVIPFWVLKEYEQQIPLTSHIIKNGKML